MKDKRIEVFNYPHVLLAKDRGFTLIEILVTVGILIIFLASLLLTLSTGQLSYSLNSAKLELQSGARLAMTWITKDLRQVISWNVASIDNNPSTAHIKFNLWVWNSVTVTWDLQSGYIEYDYDAVLQKLTRRFVDNVGNISILEFRNIIEAPFYTTYLGSGNPGNTLDADELRNNRKLIVVISTQKLFRDSLLLPATLKSEVKIRNG